MFLMPLGDVINQNEVEGQSEERPIFLEGYLAADFAALLKVLYPSSSALVNGLILSKTELVGVLKLATVWGMAEIRSYAIEKLDFECDVGCAERIALAQTHKISSWFKDSIVSIVSGKTELSYEEFQELDSATALRILWAKDQVSPLKEYRQDDKTKYIECEDSALKCNTCRLVPFKDTKCSKCNRKLDKLHLKRVTLRPGVNALSVEALDVFCPLCGRSPFNELPWCAGWIGRHQADYFILQSSRSSAVVEEVFKDELADFRLADV
ncbi:hypothetical protein EST38_g6017 [Candolleomyces aberdarensis]|uniref:BTB domain-containing protein n=1 Tax=Candolleomyces aberdarensis TaxID=2316362 RepID=A0A4Q2DJ03_9AGAR|nr:hypothetical protein EST38_g6017 [Candolleomyces aberdarensis]